jgi:hypothetical protein
MRTSEEYNVEPLALTLIVDCSHMPPDPLIGRRPEDQELAKKEAELSRLQSLLADKELSLTALRTELSAFEQTYIRTVGKRYAELDEIEAMIAEYVARMQPENVNAGNAASQARSQAQASRAAFDGSLAARTITSKSSQSQTLKNLYREVAKRIHPDLAIDSTDRIQRERLMTAANRAYEEGDETRLRAILEEYESSPESVRGDTPGAELVRVIRKIALVERRLAEIEEAVLNLEQSDHFKLKAKVDQATAEGRDLLREMAATLDSQIGVSRERLRSLSERDDNS